MSRIWFEENPWPAGHALARATWSGRLDPARGLVFDLDVETARYYAEHPGVEPTGTAPDWKHPRVWANYHRCSISSTKWGGTGGFVVGTAAEPLAWEKLSGTTVRVDEADTELIGDPDDAAFAIYLLGHDGVADHHIAFTQTGATWDVDWTAKIALVYAGDTRLTYRLRAELRGLTFGGFALPEKMTRAAAMKQFGTLVRDPDSWTIAKRRFVRA